MEKYKEIKGDLIELAKKGEFDVIAHGVNCFCTMGAGIAVAMRENFFCDKFPLEDKTLAGSIEKLGQIDYKMFELKQQQAIPVNIVSVHFNNYDLTVVNCYTQYHYGQKYGIPFDYEAFTLCMRKINHVFKGKHIGLPKIGARLAGGDWNIIEEIIKRELKDCNVTVVIYNK